MQAETASNESFLHSLSCRKYFYSILSLSLLIISIFYNCSGRKHKNFDADIFDDISDIPSDIYLNQDVDIHIDSEIDTDMRRSSKHAPIILSLNTDVKKLTQDEAVKIVAIVTDPDGIDDVIGGELVTGQGLSFGAFTSPAQEGSYQLSISWDDINKIDPIEFVSAKLLIVTAKFFDVSGEKVEQNISLELHCKGLGACNGVCTSLETIDNCGGCRVKCAGLDQDCVNRKCECRAGTLLCNGACVDIIANNDHCGDCNKSCADIAGQTCVNKICKCPDDNPNICQKKCTNLKSDSQNCGICEKDCGIFNFCLNSTCPSGQWTKQCYYVDNSYRDLTTCKDLCEKEGKICDSQYLCNPYPQDVGGGIFSKHEYIIVYFSTESSCLQGYLMSPGVYGGGVLYKDYQCGERIAYSKASASYIRCCCSP